MKRWLSLALAGLGMCLLLVLGRLEAARGADNHPCLRSWARYAGPAGHPALPSPPAAWAAQATSRQAHAAPSESRAVHEVLLTESDPGPPWLVSRGPPGKVRGIVVDWAGGQIGSPRQAVRIVPEGQTIRRGQIPAQEGVLQQPLAREEESFPLPDSDLARFGGAPGKEPCNARRAAMLVAHAIQTK